MCRILYASADVPFAIADLLRPFAELSRNSREYQGHGWGCAWREHGQWRIYHDIRPMWEDDPAQFATTSLLLVHARSAFRDEGISVENNMPFTDGKAMFVFNGELQGVRVKSEGRIGAEKIFNYIRRFNPDDRLAALRKGTRIINHRTRYVRAMNIVLSDGISGWYSSTYNEDPDYFQMQRSERGGIRLLCSEAFPGETDWRPVANHTTNLI